MIWAGTVATLNQLHQQVEGKKESVIWWFVLTLESIKSKIKLIDSEWLNQNPIQKVDQRGSLIGYEDTLDSSCYHADKTTKLEHWENLN
jgi:hypothetical protein